MAWDTALSTAIRHHTRRHTIGCRRTDRDDSTENGEIEIFIDRKSRNIKLNYNFLTFIIDLFAIYNKHRTKKT